MFSGKSEEMIRRLRRAEIAGQRVVIFKPRVDDRYDAADVVSHAGVRMRAVPVENVAELLRRADGYDVVGIDEVQFFERAVLDAALALADRGARVVAAGLDQDFRRLPFGPMPELMALAELVDKLQAVCHRCGGPATTTQRLVDGRPAPYSGATVVIVGGACAVWTLHAAVVRPLHRQLAHLRRDVQEAQQRLQEAVAAQGQAKGVNEAFADVCRTHRMDWSKVLGELKQASRYHVETY